MVKPVTSIINFDVEWKEMMQEEEMLRSIDATGKAYHETTIHGDDQPWNVNTAGHAPVIHIRRDVLSSQPNSRQRRRSNHFQSSSQ
jgi:hypothetical protein